MKRKLLQLAVIFLFALSPATLLAAVQGQDVARQTTVLYDGSLGGTPNTQGFDFLAIGVKANQSFASGMTTLDTTPEIADLAGYFKNKEILFDRMTGFDVDFTVQIEQEAHNNQNRAGFSIIVLSEDLLGIELGFWTNEIWAQEGGTDQIFRHAEGVTFDTAANLVTYRLNVDDTVYTLYANDVQILTGPLRDYTAFSGTIDPYETPNLLFLGDNTQRAQTKSNLSYVAVETTELATATPMPTATFTVTPSLTPTATPTAVPPATTTPAPTPEPTRLFFWWLPCTAGYPK